VSLPRLRVDSADPGYAQGMRWLRIAVVSIALLCTPATALAQQKEATASGKGGAAATVDPLATQAAIDVLREGGNAVDAAVAAAGVLGVTEPFSCGIGGGGFMVIRTRDGRVTTIDSREESPAAMRPDSFFENGAALPFVAARWSGLSAGVPGTVRGWQRALQRHGSWSLGSALQAGVDVAREGFVVDQTFVDQTQPNVDWFDDVPSTAALYLDPDRTPRDVGEVLRNPDLARTYELIAQLGPRGFYRGPVAEAMVAAAMNPPIAADANHIWRPGLMSTEDVRSYRAPQRPPTRIRYRGLDVYGMGPPSSGGSTVGEALNILEGFALSPRQRARALHLFLEASRFSFADRGAYLADPKFFDVPLSGLLSDGFAAERRALINPNAATTSAVPPGDPYDNQGDPSRAAALGTTAERGRSTTHLVVSDRAGTVVSYTFTIESTGGNGIVVPGYGFLLNNELTDFDFSLLEHPNRADGGKRPRSSMSPTIVLERGRPLLAVGSPGGSMIITTTLQVLLERLELGATLPEAIAQPRASQRNAATTSAEQAFIDSPDGLDLAGTFGHAFTPTAEIGAVTGLEFMRGGRVLAAAEPTRRGGGSAMVELPERDD
jgi:gamma-glutamyltranspeptidase / glutathione hydrolase